MAMPPFVLETAPPLCPSKLIPFLWKKASPLILRNGNYNDRKGRKVIHFATVLRTPPLYGTRRLPFAGPGRTSILLKNQILL